MTASGGRAAAFVERLLAGRGRLDLVAGAAERRLERAQDLRLVVDDEDARSAHAVGLDRHLDERKREHEGRALALP